MTAPHDRSRARSRRAAAGRAAVGSALLIVLLAVLPALRHASADPLSVRIGGISIAWWYGGLLAPVAGWLVAIWALKTPNAARSDVRTRDGAEPDEPVAAASLDDAR